MDSQETQKRPAVINGPVPGSDEELEALFREKMARMEEAMWEKN